MRRKSSMSRSVRPSWLTRADCGHYMAQPGDGEHIRGRFLCQACARRARDQARAERLAAERAGQLPIPEEPESGAPAPVAVPTDPSEDELRSRVLFAPQPSLFD